MDNTSFNILFEICQHLDTRSILKFGACAKKYNKIVKSDNFWRQKLFIDFGYKNTFHMWDKSFTLYRSLYMGSFIHYDNKPTMPKEIVIERCSKDFFRQIKIAFDNFPTKGTLLWTCTYKDYLEIVAIRNLDLHIDYCNRYDYPKDIKLWQSKLCYLPPIHTDKINRLWSLFTKRLASERLENGKIDEGQLLTEIMNLSFSRKCEFIIV